MKNSTYFSHDSNARNDEKMIAIRKKYGMRGYGIFFGLVEMLREANAYQLQMDWSILAYDLREDEKMIADIVKMGFKNNGKKFWSESLNARMVKMEEISKKRADAGRKGGLS